MTRGQRRTARLIVTLGALALTLIFGVLTVIDAVGDGVGTPWVGLCVVFGVATVASAMLLRRWENQGG